MTHNLAELPFMTPERYLSIERHSPDRHEYINGVMYAMAGGTPRHSEVILNVGTALRNHLRGSNCKAYTSELRVFNHDTGSFLYPDISVICGEPILSALDKDTVVNPLLLIEVLSPSTEAYDRGAKFAHYRRLDTLQVYVLVAQDQPRIETYTRSGDDWILTVFNGMDAELKIPAINLTVPLSEIYEGVNFDTL
jgi:Uma2 family endonuclease